MAQRLKVDPKAPKPKLIRSTNRKYWIILKYPESKLNLSLPTWSVATYVLLLLISIWLFCR